MLLITIIKSIAYLVQKNIFESEYYIYYRCVGETRRPSMQPIFNCASPKPVPISLMQPRTTPTSSPFSSSSATCRPFQQIYISRLYLYYCLRGTKGFLQIKWCQEMETSFRKIIIECEIRKDVIMYKCYIYDMVQCLDLALNVRKERVNV